MRADLPREELLEHDDLSRRVYVLACRDGVNQEISCRKPRIGIVLQTSKELFTSQRGGFPEEGLLGIYIRYLHQQDGSHRAYIHCLGVDRFIPSGIQMTDATREVGAAPVQRLDVCGVLRDAIIDRVDGFDEFLHLRSIPCAHPNVVNRRTLYIFNHKVSTFSSSVGSWVTFEMTSFPKCLQRQSLFNNERNRR